MGIADFFRSRTTYARVAEAGADTVDGTRTAMLEAYRNSRDRDLTEQQVPVSQNDLFRGVVASPVHAFALFEALASRYWSTGVSRAQIKQRTTSIWVELSPFLYLDLDEAPDALAEYVAWKEARDDFPDTLPEVRVDWLQEKVRVGVARAEEAGAEWVSAARNEAENSTRDEREQLIRWAQLL